MRSRARLWAPLALAVSVLATGCAGGAEPPQGGGTEDLKGAEELPEAQQDLTDVIALLDEEAPLTGADTRYQVDVTGETAIRMVADGNVGNTALGAWFEPSILVGEPGQTLTIALVNGDVRPHNLTVPDLGIDEYIQVEESGTEPPTVQVTFPEGDEPSLFFCEFHEEYGQVGALVASS